MPATSRLRFGLLYGPGVDDIAHAKQSDRCTVRMSWSKDLGAVGMIGLGTIGARR